MKKAKCANGHFYDAEKFSACPVCGMSSSVGETVKMDRESQPTPRRGFFTWPKPSAENAAAAAPGKPERRVSELAKTERLYDPADEPPQEIPLAREQTGATVSAEVPLENDASPLSGDVPKEDAFAPPASKQPEAAPARDTDEMQQQLQREVAGTAATCISPLSKTVAFYDFASVEPPVGWLVGLNGSYRGREFVCHGGRNKIGRSPEMDISLPEEITVSREIHAMIVYDPLHRTFFLQSGTGAGLTYLNGNIVMQYEELHGYDVIEMGKARFIFLPLCGDRFSWDEPDNF